MQGRHYPLNFTNVWKIQRHACPHDLSNEWWRYRDRDWQQWHGPRLRNRAISKIFREPKILFVCAKDSMQKKGNELVYEKSWSGSSVGRWSWKHMHQLGTVSVLRAVNQTPKCHQCSRFLLSFGLMIHSVKLNWEMEASWAWTSLSHAPMWAHTHSPS